MKFIGNFAEWIKPEWVEYLLANDGSKRPSGERIPIRKNLKLQLVLDMICLKRIGITTLVVNFHSM